MKKKILSLILALVMLCALFAGCAGTAQPTDSEAPAESQPAEQSEQPEAPEPEQPEAPAEQPQEEAEQPEPELTMPELVLPLCDELETLSIYLKDINLRPPLDTLGITAWGEFEYLQHLEEMTNVHIDFQAASFMVFTEQFNLYIAAGEYADMIQAVSTQYAGGSSKALEDDVIVDLAPYLEEFAPHYSYYMNSNEVFGKEFRIDGGYVTDFKSFYDDFRQNNGLLIRKDWLDELGMEVPQTYDQMAEALAAFKSEFGADTPFFMSSNCSVDGFIGGFEVLTGVNLFQKDGEVKCSILEDGFMDYLALMQDWYNNGYIDHDFISIQYDPFSPVISDGVGSDTIAVWPAIYEEVESYARYNENPNFAVAPVGALVKNLGEIDHITARKMIDNDTISISTQCENVELAVKWMDFWYSDPGFLMFNYGKEGLSYEIVDGEPVYTDFVVNNDLGITVSSFMRSQCPYGSLTGVYSPTRLEPYMTELQLDCWDIWTATMDGAWSIPTGVSLSAMESEERSLLITDIETCVEENLCLFISGEKPMDQWDAFIDQLMGLQLERVIEIQQGALDRYNER